MKIANIDHLNLSVKNLDETVAFYQKFFELEVKESGEYNDQPYAIIGKKNAFYLCLYQTSENISYGMFNHFGIHVDNFEQLKSKFESHGIELLYGGVVPYPESQSIYVADPNGIEIEISNKFAGGLS